MICPNCDLELILKETPPYYNGETFFECSCKFAISLTKEKTIYSCKDPKRKFLVHYYVNSIPYIAYDGNVLNIYYEIRPDHLKTDIEKIIKIITRLKNFK